MTKPVTRHSTKEATMSEYQSSIDSTTSQAMRKIVTFKVGTRTFGIDVAAVREIKGWHPATPLAACAAARTRRHQPARHDPGGL
jgi:hypothetical protein